MVKTHTKKITAFLSVVAMLFSMLLYFPGGTFSSHDLGLTVSAEGEEGVTFTAIAGTGDGDEGYASLIDGKFTESNFSKWCVTGFTSVADGGNGAYIIFSASEPISVTGYSIVTGNDNAEWIDRNPKSWTLYGCNDETANSAAGKDSTSWEVIDAITDDTQLEDKNYTEYVYDELTGSTSTRYQYFKLEITATQGADVLQMSEFILHNRVKTDTTIAPTCTEGGYDVYECSICGWQKKVSDGTPALGHNFVEGVCTRCGVADTTPKEPSVDNGVYQIGTAGELYWFAGLVNGDASVCDYDETDNPTGTKQNTSANAVLTADITVNSNLLNSLNDDGTVPEGTTVTSWTPIGWYDVDNDIGYSYTGTFDGNSHTVSGLYFNNISTDCVGLFGYVGSGGSVSNLGVEDSYFKGRFHIGGVCGKNDGTITNCYHTGAVSATGEYASVGGVCGYNYNGTITNCYNTGAVSGTGSDARIGGVCGENYYAGGTATVTNCYNTGAVSTGSSDWVGGVCGRNLNYLGTAIITNCYYDSTVYSGNAVYNEGGTVSENVLGKATSDFTNGTVCGLVGYHSHKKNGFCSLCKGDYESAVYNEIANRYEISNAGQLYWFADYVNSGNTNANAVLTADIVVNESVINENGELNTGNFKSWIPIGNTRSNTYTGIFNGRKNTISGLYFNNENTNYVGLFGCSQGTIKNVGVVDSYFKGQNSVGGVCGGNYGTITNCYNAGVVIGSSNVGGVCGANGSFSIITNCSNKGEVSGTDYVGGVCGYNYYGTIKNCYNASKVSGSDNNGGVCGGNEDTITNCYFDSDKYSGNAVGYNDGTVTNVNGKTTAQFNSGEVAYLLSQGENGSVWGQDLNTESSPALGGAKVYATKGCITYNNDGDESDKLHDYKDGVCADCGMIDPKLTNKNYPTEVGYTGEALAAPTAENFTYSGAGELTFTWYDGETKLNTSPTDLGEYTLVVAIGESGDYGASAITLTVKIVKGTPGIHRSCCHRHLWSDPERCGTPRWLHMAGRGNHFRWQCRGERIQGDFHT